MELQTSRRYRKDDYMHREHLPPFHISQPVPPWRKEGRKFDINWQNKCWKHVLYHTWFRWKYRKLRKKYSS